jgi:hypothetical protein
MAKTSVASIPFVCFCACFGDQVQKLRRPAMHELGSQLDGFVRNMMSKDAPADALTRLNDSDLQSGLCKPSSGSKAGHAGSDDQNLIVNH